MLPSAESPGSCMCSMDGVGPGVVGVTQGHGGTRGAPLLSHHGGQACKRHQPPSCDSSHQLGQAIRLQKLQDTLYQKSSVWTSSVKTSQFGVLELSIPGTSSTCDLSRM